MTSAIPPKGISASGDAADTGHPGGHGGPGPFGGLIQNAVFGNGSIAAAMSSARPVRRS